MSTNWVQINFNEKLSEEETDRKDRNHSFRGVHGNYGFPQFCRHCGHVNLSNYISNLVSRIGCDYEKDSRYRQWLNTIRKR